MSPFPFSQLSSYMLSSDSWCHNRNKHGYTRIQNGKWHKRCESFPTRMLFAFEILHTVPCCSSTKRSPFKIKALWLACEDAKEKPWESSSVCSQRCLAVDPSIDLFFFMIEPLDLAEAWEEISLSHMFYDYVCEYTTGLSSLDLEFPLSSHYSLL